MVPPRGLPVRLKGGGGGGGEFHQRWRGVGGLRQPEVSTTVGLAANG